MTLSLIVVSSIFFILLGSTLITWYFTEPPSRMALDKELRERTLSDPQLMELYQRTVDSEIRVHNMLPFAGGLSIIIGGGIIVGSALHHIEDRKPKERRFCAVCGWVLLEPSGFCENCAKRKLTSAEELHQVNESSGYMVDRPKG